MRSKITLTTFIYIGVLRLGPWAGALIAVHRRAGEVAARREIDARGDGLREQAAMNLAVLSGSLLGLSFRPLDRLVYDGDRLDYFALALGLSRSSTTSSHFARGAGAGRETRAHVVKIWVRITCGPPRLSS